MPSNLEGRDDPAGVWPRPTLQEHEATRTTCALAPINHVVANIYPPITSRKGCMSRSAARL